LHVASLWQLWSGSRFKQQQALGHYNDLLKYYEGQPSIATREIDKVRFGGKMGVKKIGFVQKFP
jgi:hypothetical protein